MPCLALSLTNEASQKLTPTRDALVEDFVVVGVAIVLSLLDPKARIA